MFFQCKVASTSHIREALKVINNTGRSCSRCRASGPHLSCQLAKDKYNWLDKIGPYLKRAPGHIKRFSPGLSFVSRCHLSVSHKQIVSLRFSRRLQLVVVDRVAAKFIFFIFLSSCFGKVAVVRLKSREPVVYSKHNACSLILAHLVWWSHRNMLYQQGTS